MDEEQYSSSDKEQVEKETKKAKINELHLKEDIRFLISSPQGKRYFRNLFNRFPIFQPKALKDSRIYFWDGVANVMWSIFNDLLESDKDNFVKMLFYMEEDI